MKKYQKNIKNTSRCVESNGIKNFKIFVHLVYIAVELLMRAKEILNALIFENF
jgi:hypothetical protein